MAFSKRTFYSFFAVMLTNASFASDAHHGINWWHLGSEYKDEPAVGWLTITFLIFVYGLAHAIKKPLSLYLETRSKDIRRQIEEGQKAKAESEEKLRLYEEKLKSLDGEIEKMREAFLTQGRAEKAERERLAKILEERILREADDTIKSSVEQTKNRLAEEVIKKAVALAEETIKDKKRAEVDLALKSAFIKDLNNTAIKETIKDKKRDQVDRPLKPAFIDDLKTIAKEVQ